MARRHVFRRRRLTIFDFRVSSYSKLARKRRWPRRIAVTLGAALGAALAVGLYWWRT